MVQLEYISDFFRSLSHLANFSSWSLTSTETVKWCTVQLQSTVTRTECLIYGSLHRIESLSFERDWAKDAAQSIEQTNDTSNDWQMIFKR